MNISKRKVINPASGAIVMAFGIFLEGAMNYFFGQGVGRWFVMIYFTLSAALYTKWCRQIFQKEFLSSLINNPVNSFTLGSWVAGCSVLLVVVDAYFSFFHPIAIVMTAINTLFWLAFLMISVVNFKRLWTERIHVPHGVILLSTVATQSIVILWNEMFPSLPEYLSLTAIFVGVSFYIISFYLITRRYWSTRWSLAEDWTNTNCILHGALSITGLALVSTGVWTGTALLYYWVLVFVVLCLVEGMEVIRACQRVRRKGWKEGIFSYHISQWSRNFTFGMFYTFTLMMHEALSPESLLYSVHEVFLPVLAWVVLGTLVVEVGLWLMRKLVQLYEWSYV
ncbi:hypothetical protein EQV77_06715 [Halobacillus fulvus]|nr:hypothetical protein EQV77_06715 [Halobacillus fulvus]